jgi:hypothetical protein
LITTAIITIIVKKIIALIVTPTIRGILTEMFELEGSMLDYEER